MVNDDEGVDESRKEEWRAKKHGKYISKKRKKK